MAMACRPEEQKRLTVVPATETGSPARTSGHARDVVALGAVGLGAAQDHVLDLASDRAAGALPSTSLMQWAARSSGRVRLNDPR